MPAVASAPAEARTTLWVSPNPLLPGQDIYYSEVSGRYVNAATAEPIYFAGTDPRDPGDFLHQTSRRKWAARAFSGSATCERACDTL